MPSTGGFQLTAGDVAILTYVYQCRLVTIEHLIVLTGRSRRVVNRRLVKLTDQKYLYRKRSFPFMKYVYTINRAAATELVERGVASKETLDLRVRLHELTELFLRHALMLTDVHVALEVASRGSPIKLVEWREGKELYDSVILLEDGERKKYPVRPDAFFTLQDTRRPGGKNMADFFLEVDRSTTTSKRFQRKMKGYWGYFKEGLHEKKYGIRSARVITITLTEARAVNLCEAVREVIPREEGRFYYFAPVKWFSVSSPEQVFGEIFMTPRDYETGKRYSLIPPLAK